MNPPSSKLASPASKLALPATKLVSPIFVRLNGPGGASRWLRASAIMEFTISHMPGDVYELGIRTDHSWESLAGYADRKDADRDVAALLDILEGRIPPFMALPAPLSEHFPAGDSLRTGTPIYRVPRPRRKAFSGRSHRT